MDKAALLVRYDREQRREIVYHDARREALPGVVRHISHAGDGNFVLYSSLTEADVDQEIEAQIAYFEEIGADFEWKAFEHDAPPDLCQRLARHGFAIDDPEAVMVLDLESASLARREPINADIRRIQAIEDVADVAAVEELVWQRDFGELTARLRRDLRDIPDGIDLYVAYVDGKPASAAWIYYHNGTSFASLWGGATVERYRGRGIYTALLDIRAMEAKNRGFRFLTVDASPMSQPILERHGFRTITHARACTWQSTGKRVDEIQEKPMNAEHTQCIAATKAGTRCKNSAQPGSDYCHIHQHLAEAAPPSPPDTTETAPATVRPPEEIVADMASTSRANFEILANELNALAIELQRSIPEYRPPAFSTDGLVSLVRRNLDKFAPDIQIEIVSELRRNLEGTTPRDLIDPDTWKGLWYILNYMAHEQSTAMLEKLYARLSTLPGMALLSDLKGNLEGTSPKEFLDPDTWKGMWYIMSYSVQATASDVKRKLIGEDDDEE